MPADSTTLLLEVRRLQPQKDLRLCRVVSSTIFPRDLWAHDEGSDNCKDRTRVVPAGGTTNFLRIGEHKAKEPTTSAPSTM